MNLPTFLTGSYEQNFNYHSELAQTLQDSLGDNGFYIPQVSNALRLILINAVFPVVLPAGTLWFNTDTGFMQFINTPAIPANMPGGPANAVTSTITSTVDP